jgi:hypothetical protein
MSESGYASLGPTLLARKGGAKPAMRPQLPVLGESAEVAKLADEQLEDLGWNDMGDDDAEESAIAGVVVPIDPETPFDAAAAAASPIVRRQQRRLEERVLADAVMTGPEDLAAEYDAADDEDSFAANEADYAPLHDDEPDFNDNFAGADSFSGAEAFGDASTFADAEPVLATRPVKDTKPARSPLAPASAGRRAAFTLRLDPDRHLKLRLAATMRGVSAQALVTDALDALLAEFEELNVIAARLQRH